MAGLITCSWCDHSMIGIENHGRTRIDERPKQCADCGECKARRLRGEAPGVEDDVSVTRIPIEQADTGMSLMVKRGAHAYLFQIEKKTFSYSPDAGTVFTLESEPVDGGDPWVICGPPGTPVIRVMRKR
jgi:hypothetical protein